MVLQFGKETDENGWYQFWSLNGAELNVWSWANNTRTLTIFGNATLFDEE